MAQDCMSPPHPGPLPRWGRGRRSSPQSDQWGRGRTGPLLSGLGDFAARSQVAARGCHQRALGDVGGARGISPPPPPPPPPRGGGGGEGKTRGGGGGGAGCGGGGFGGGGGLGRAGGDGQGG